MAKHAPAKAEETKAPVIETVSTTVNIKPKRNHRSGDTVFTPNNGNAVAVTLDVTTKDGHAVHAVASTGYQPNKARVIYG